MTVAFVRLAACVCVCVAVRVRRCRCCYRRCHSGHPDGAMPVRPVYLVEEDICDCNAQAGTVRPAH